MFIILDSMSYVNYLAFVLVLACSFPYYNFKMCVYSAVFFLRMNNLYFISVEVFIILLTNPNQIHIIIEVFFAIWKTGRRLQYKDPIWVGSLDKDQLVAPGDRCTPSIGGAAPWKQICAILKPIITYRFHRTEKIFVIVFQGQGY